MTATLIPRKVMFLHVSIILLKGCAGGMYDPDGLTIPHSSPPGQTRPSWGRRGSA